MWRGYRAAFVPAPEDRLSDVVVDTSALPKAMDFDDGDGAVVASANVTLHDFLAELSRRKSR